MLLRRNDKNSGSPLQTHPGNADKTYRRPANVTLRKLRAQLADCSHWPEQLLFLDVETTGLNHRSDQITVMGWSFGGCVSTFVSGQDPSLLRDDAARAKALITFNGGRFDIKFIRREFPDVVFPRIHIDLMFVCSRIGLRGGQKSIEGALRINLRDDESRMGGADAVVLWQKYTEGDRDALRKLILYNRADVAAMGAMLDQVADVMDMKSESSFQDVRFQDWSAPAGWDKLSDTITPAPP